MPESIFCGVSTVPCHLQCFLVESHHRTTSWQKTPLWLLFHGLVLCWVAGKVPRSCRAWSLCVAAAALDITITGSPSPFCKVWARGTAPRRLCLSPSSPHSQRYPPPPNPFRVTAISPDEGDALLSTTNNSSLTLPKNSAIAFCFSLFFFFFLALN